MRVRRAIVLIATAVGALACVPASAAAQGFCLPPLIPCAPPPPPPVPPPPPPPPPLQLGLTESDPRLLIPVGTGLKVIALKPAYVRVLVPWQNAQPHAGMVPNWDAAPGGCPRLAPSCGSELGLRGQLQAIKARQRADGGWKILVVPYFTPRWAASPARGCQKARYRNPRAQMPRIAPYRRFLRGLWRLADEVGVRIDYVTPWNEPNHPGFLNPQREVCDRRSKALSPALYARLVRAAARELRPEQTLVLGSLAGLEHPRVYGAGAAEFIRGLPRDVACVGGPFAQHAYIGEPGRNGRRPPRADAATAARPGLLEDVVVALDAKGCTDPKALWIGETGTFDHRCAAMAAALRSWADNDRIDAAFQYTFRESPAFPVGLVSPSLEVTYDSYRAWLAFAGGPATVPQSPC